MTGKLANLTAMAAVEGLERTAVVGPGNFGRVGLPVPLLEAVYFSHLSKELNGRLAATSTNPCTPACRSA